MKAGGPTVREIAKVAGVSISTVSRALNSDVPVSSAARKKIEAAIASLTGSTHNTVLLKDRSVGIIMPDASAGNLKEHPLIYSIVASFEDHLASYGVTFRVLDYDDISEIEKLLQPPMDGYFVIGTSAEDDVKLLEVMQRGKTPWLIMNRHLENEFVSNVSLDDEYASESAVRYLIGLGHRRIAFIGGNPDYQNTARRYRGYESALQKAGLPVRREYVFFGDYSELSGYQRGKDMLSLRNRPTASFCASDTIAFGFMQYLTDHGVQLPRDMAIIGFGNIEKGNSTSPTLTTIDQRYADTGIIAAKALIQLMETPSIAYQQTLVKTRLIIRESSGGPVNRMKK